MRVTCSNCEARLQLDESKIPPHAFKVKCPKCQSAITIRSAQTDAMNLPPEMTPPATDASPFERPAAAARFEPDAANTATADNSTNTPDVVKILADVLRQHNAGGTAVAQKKRAAWDRRKALVCTDEQYRDVIANGLSENYDVFV